MIPETNLSALLKETKIIPWLEIWNDLNDGLNERKVEGFF